MEEYRPLIERDFGVSCLGGSGRAKDSFGPIIGRAKDSSCGPIIDGPIFFYEGREIFTEGCTSLVLVLLIFVVVTSKAPHPPFFVRDHP